MAAGSRTSRRNDPMVLERPLPAHPLDHHRREKARQRNLPSRAQARPFASPRLRSETVMAGSSEARLLETHSRSRRAIHTAGKVTSSTTSFRWSAAAPMCPPTCSGRRRKKQRSRTGPNETAGANKRIRVIASALEAGVYQGTCPRYRLLTR